MSGKDTFVDFISYVVGLLLLAFVVFFIIVGDRFEAVMSFFVSLAPLAVFAFVAVVILNFRKREIKKKREEQNFEMTLFLNYADKLSSDLAFTGIPVLVMLIALLMNGKIEIEDILQSLLVFVILYIYFKALYSKAR
ncbi:hypothetical protein C0584_03430 [Candidatus Parcubacteria bacterium]|nr:MAG: hypothetical protein C0584_03430 [Candidatus Parcubacteria bacterium]